MKKAIIIFIGLPIVFCLLVGLYFFDNIKGYYRFKHYCETEGGLTVYKKLEKNMGWMADGYHNARTVANLDHVDFVRYLDKDGEFYDLRYKGGHVGKKNSYDSVKSDLTKKVKYKWKFSNGVISDELRLGYQYYEIFDVYHENLVIIFKSFGYSIFEKNNTLFAAPPGVGCYRLSEGKDLIENHFKLTNRRKVLCQSIILKF